MGSSDTSLQPDLRVFLFAGLVALATMMILSLVPLSQVAQSHLLPVLQSGSAQRTEGRTSVVRRVAIWGQIAISFALLVSTGALVRSFLNTRTQSIGLTRNQVLLAWTQEPDAPMVNDVIDRMKALPGVERVAYAMRSPLSLSEGGSAVRTLIPSHPELHDPVDIKFNAVSAGFLDVIGTRIVRGRGLTAEDDANGPAVVVINRAMAQKYWSTQDPIGQVVILPGVQSASGKATEARVVGVAENAPINQIGEIPEPYLYLPFHLVDMGEITFALETKQNAMSLAQSARQVLIHEDPLLDPMMVTSLPELIRYSAGSYQMTAELVSALGFIGLALTVVGLYGFLAFRVAQRKREIGIRMALGASREATALMILRDTTRLAGMGLGLGIVLAIAASRLESSVVFGVQPLDPISIAAAIGILTMAAAAASWLPARRAASIEPMQALRTE
jgi:predicted permease